MAEGAQTQGGRMAEVIEFKYYDDYDGGWRHGYTCSLPENQSGRYVRESDYLALQAQRDELLEDVEKAMKLANHRWCEWGERALSVSVALDEAIDKARAAIRRVKEVR